MHTCVIYYIWDKVCQSFRIALEDKILSTITSTEFFCNSPDMSLQAHPAVPELRSQFVIPMCIWILVCFRQKEA